jgi:hypothetical protein
VVNGTQGCNPPQNEGGERVSRRVGELVSERAGVGRSHSQLLHPS